ncbi:hypothetical protein H5410_038392 [Solanum commersonii]|uniref:Uncharacterized protein n=1 Tax=Solanum commersonii TaxID=4109 RepID=A0A9J5YC63_SOLCO|nr:hypothetical protein H5410_038392 [Solanum commersonii]
MFKNSANKRNKDARRGESDRVIPTLKPKHLFSGKRSNMLCILSSSVRVGAYLVPFSYLECKTTIITFFIGWPLEFADVSRCFLLQKFGWRTDGHMQKENLCWNANSPQLILGTLFDNFGRVLVYLNIRYEEHVKTQPVAVLSWQHKTIDFKFN